MVARYGKFKDAIQCTRQVYDIRRVSAAYSDANVNGNFPGDLRPWTCNKNSRRKSMEHDGTSTVESLDSVKTGSGSSNAVELKLRCPFYVKIHKNSKRASICR